MSVPGPFGGGDPFEGIPIFRDLARMFTAAGPVNWEIAKQVAAWTATEGAPEANVEPLRRIRLEEIGRVAELHVAEATGLDLSSGGRALTLKPVGRAEWANRTLEDYRDLLEQLAGGLRPATEDGEAGDDPATQLLGNLTHLIGPVLVGMQAGFTVGHLAQRAFGQYVLPIPRPESDHVLVLPRAIDSFAEDWSLPPDDVALWVALSEVAHHAVLSRPAVRKRLNEYLGEYVRGFRPDPSALEDRLGGLDPTDPASFQSVLGDPETLLGALETDEQGATLRKLSALTVVVEGYVDHVVDVAGRRLISSHGSLTEALRRRRVERAEGTRFVERLLGLELTQAHYERGAAFVRGVLERGGEESLARLWRSERELPTPAEIDAPGLWLERIDLPD